MGNLKKFIRVLTCKRSDNLLCEINRNELTLARKIRFATLL